MKRQDGPATIRVAVAAPFPEIVRLHELAAEYADELEVCAMISDPDKVLEQARLLQPDVLLLSEELGPRRADTLARLTAIAPATRLVMLVSEASAAAPVIADGAVALGASAAQLRAAIVAAREQPAATAAPAAHARVPLPQVVTPAPTPVTPRDPEQPAPATPGDEAGHSTARVVLVFSGKGGVGTSIVATNLATAIAGRGARVGLVDLNLQYGDLGVLLRLEEHQLTIESVAAHGAPLDDVLATTEQGVRVLLAPSSPEASDLVPPSQVEAILGRLAAMVDYVVVDTAAQLEERVVGVMEVADDIILVSSFGITSVKDTKVTLRLLQSLGVEPGRVAVVLNQTRQRVSFPAEDIAGTLRFPVLANVPYEPRMEESIESGRPLVVTEPRSGFAKQLALVADHVVRHREGVALPKVRRHAARWRLRFRH